MTYDTRAGAEVARVNIERMRRMLRPCLAFVASALLLAAAPAPSQTIYAPAMEAWLHPSMLPDHDTTPGSSRSALPQVQAGKVYFLDWFPLGRDMEAGRTTQTLVMTGKKNWFMASGREKATHVDCEAYHVAYDATRKAMYRMRDFGCKGNVSEVLAVQPAAPSRSLRSVDLGGLHSLHGIRLGMSIDEVRRRYGPARSQAYPGRPDWRLMSYEIGTERGPGHFDAKKNPVPCGFLADFVFYRDRLHAAQFEMGCD